jgi:hypothetical protein
MTGSLSVVTTAVSSAKFGVVYSGEVVGLQSIVPWCTPALCTMSCLSVVLFCVICVFLCCVLMYE